MTSESISLYFKDARSDKEYHVQLKPQGEGWMVHYQNGPRGGTLAAGTKTTEPVAFDKAKKAYDKVVKEKISKGYTPAESGAAYSSPELAGRASGLSPMLLNLASPEEVEAALRDPAWGLQEKYDGHRRLALAKEHELVGANRRGLVTGLPERAAAILAEAMGGVPVQFAVDAELIGQKLVLFDVLLLPGRDLRALPYESRLQELSKLECALAAVRAHDTADHIMVARTYYSEADKRAALAAAKAARAEGVVFKRLDAAYVAGKPAEGGPALKLPFRHRATFLLNGHHPTKRSIGLALLDAEGRRIGVGNCAVPANHEMPAADALIEVEYLYAFEGGSVFQPQYKGTRDDIEPTACTLSQLVFKRSADTNEDDDEGSEAEASTAS